MKMFFLAVSAAIIAAPAVAADTPATADPVPVYHSDMRGSAHVDSGYYLKGQLGYLWNDFRGSTYAVTGGTARLNGELDDSWYAGVGVGYQINRYLRTDVMFDYMFDSDFNGSTFGTCPVGPGGAFVNCVSTDTTSWNAYSLIASVYVDLDFWSHSSGWGHIVPFVGGGHRRKLRKLDNLNNEACEVGVPTNCIFVEHEGESSWRFAWQVEAGLSYYLRCDIAGEASYRYRRIEGGNMFGFAADTGPGWDDGIGVQSVNVGLRYYPGRDCEPYVPPVVPAVYK